MTTRQLKKFQDRNKPAERKEVDRNRDDEGKENFETLLLYSQKGKRIYSNQKIRTGIIRKGHKNVLLEIEN